MRDAPVGIEVLIALLFIVGAAGVLAEDLRTTEPDAEALVEDVTAGDRDFETIQGTRTTETEIKNVGADSPSYTMLTEDVWIRPPDKKRGEVVATEDHATFSAGDIRVYNGTLRQWYWEDRELMVDDDDWTPGSHVEEFDARIFEQFDAEYLGTDSVADRETHVVEITPAENASIQAALTLHFADQEFDISTVSDTAEDGNISYSTTWWIDAETRYPIKEQVKTEHHNPEQTPSSRESRIQTVRYEEITYDSEIPEETFLVDPPEGTTVGDSPEQLNVETVEEANEAVPFLVPEPPVPDRFELTWVLGWEFMGDKQVRVTYHDRDSGPESEYDGSGPSFDQLTFVFTEFPPTYTEEDIVREGVGELNATVYETGGGDTLIYYCGEIRYEVQPYIHGEDDIEVAADLADSIECPSRTRTGG